MKGKFIAIYGINNIGKSTQAKLLVEKLKAEGFEAIHLKYPVYELEPTGPKLNRILRSGKAQEISEEELQSLFVQNRIEFEPKLIDYLEKGVNVVAEDYIGTGIAWGSAKGADLAWLEGINSPLLKEDLAIFLKGKRFIEAKEERHIHESNESLMKKCEDVFDYLAKKYSWREVRVTEGIDKVADKIWSIIKAELL